MRSITGLRHVSLPAADVVRSSDWHERVLGFVPILMEEEGWDWLCVSGLAVRRTKSWAGCGAEGRRASRGGGL
jgi:hypothetical protein